MVRGVVRMAVRAEKRPPPPPPPPEEVKVEVEVEAGIEVMSQDVLVFLLLLACEKQKDTRVRSVPRLGIGPTYYAVPYLPSNVLQCRPFVRHPPWSRRDFAAKAKAKEFSII